MKIIQRPSPNFDERNGLPIEYLIIHGTGMKCAEDALNRLCDESAEVSAHYTIDEEGTVYHHVAEDKRAWHAGVSSWQGQDKINARSIGVELVNKGHEWGYHEFSDAQIDALIKLSKEILGRHNIKHVLGHSDVAPTRKTDPGELFPWQKLAQEGIGFWREGGEVFDGDVYEALSKIGYDITDKQAALVAFQRHYVPEVFESETEGEVCDLTCKRLGGFDVIA